MKKIISLLLCLLMLMPLTACGGGSSAGDGKTINVAITKTGYGDQWLKEVAEKFNDLYKDEGYKVNVLKPKNDFIAESATRDLKNFYEGNGYDIAFTAGIPISNLVNDAEGECVEDLTSLMNSKSINFDGTESEKTLVETFNGINPWMIQAENQKYYAMPYVSSISGLAYNKKVLNDFGITQIPRTTGELYGQYDEMYTKIKDASVVTTAEAPTIWGGKDAFGYSLPPLYTVMAQLLGAEKYDEFYKMDFLLDEKGKIDPEGYKMYDDPDISLAIKSGYKTIMHAFDATYSVNGSVDNDHSWANNRFMAGKAGYFFIGDYIYIEVLKSKNINNLCYAKTPIVSELGVKLGLDGANGTDKAKCETVLKEVVTLCDEGKTADEIVSTVETVTLTKEQAQGVIDARRIGNGSTSQAYILKNSPNKEMAEKFLRMLASKDSAELYAKYGLAHSFYTPAFDSTTPEFIKTVRGIMNSCDYFTTSQLHPYSVRKRAHEFVIPSYSAMLPKTIYNEIGIAENVKDRDYDALTEVAYGKIRKHAEDFWSDIVNKGGI